MRASLCAILIAFTVCGCATPSAKRPITGYYTSTPVRRYPQYADGKSHVDTTEFILILSPDGTFVTWFQMYSDGDPVHFSGLAPYDLQTNANGTWSFADGRLFLHGIGPSYIVTKWQMGAGASFPPQEDEAAAVYRDGHWVVAWRQTEYTIKKEKTFPSRAAEVDVLRILHPPEDGRKK
jgi:hypothetical protein